MRVKQAEGTALMRDVADCVAMGMTISETAKYLGIRFTTANQYAWRARQPEKYAEWRRRSYENFHAKLTTRRETEAVQTRPVFWSVAKLDELKQRIEAGDTFDECAAFFGATRGMVSGVCHRYGFKGPEPRPERDDRLFRTVETCAAVGMTAREIAEMHDININTVNVYLWRARHPEGWDRYQSRRQILQKKKRLAPPKTSCEA